MALSSKNLLNCGTLPVADRDAALSFDSLLSRTAVLDADSLLHNNQQGRWSMGVEFVLYPKQPQVWRIQSRCDFYGMEATKYLDST